MMKLTMKGTPFVWADDYEASSCALKKKLESAPILVLLESGKNFRVYTDAPPCWSWFCAHARVG